MKKYLLLFLSAALLATSCNKDDDTISPEKGFVINSEELVVQDFMWKAMNFWYFWQENVANLDDDKFPLTQDGKKDYIDFLSIEEDPAVFFDSYLTFAEDRFSFYSEDYTELTQALAGISKSNGLEFGLVPFPDSDNLVGYVRYIIPNSDAATKDISRGELFTGVNGNTLTRSNYIDLLFGDADTYTLNMASIENNVIDGIEKEVTLTKTEGLVENPIFLSKTLEVNNEKIGYLVYNSFTNEYDEQLNAVFQDFKTDGITNLVVDLRYNLGGSVNTARLLSSMIYGTNTTDVFIKQRWNDKVQPELPEKDLIDYFADTTNDGTPLNRLNLSKVYILTTFSSASSSELVINGLSPYLEVVQLGETTRGKNEFSITMVDDFDNGYIYNPERVNNINKNNSWAIQPLVGRNENADGFFDYTAGLTPNIVQQEDLANLGVLGEENEPLLARAIQDITGTTAKRDFSVSMPAEKSTSSKMFSVLKDNMVLDKPIVIKNRP